MGITTNESFSNSYPQANEPRIGDTDQNDQIEELREKGIEEAVTSHATKVEANKQAIQDLVNKSNRILLKISSVFPFQLFPSTIVVEENRITIIRRQLYSSQVHSVDIKNITNVFLFTGLFFAQLTVVSNTFIRNQIMVPKLHKNEAILMRRLIEGLRLFTSKNIDTSEYEIPELIEKLKQLSTTEIVL